MKTIARHRILLAATALTGGLVAMQPAAAQQVNWNAQPVTGLYVGLGAGANFLQESSLSQSGSFTSALRSRGYPAYGGNVNWDAGIAVLGNIGWGFGNGLRLEGEVSYRQNDVNTITGFGALGPRLTNVGGQQQSMGLMVNTLYDFQIPSSPWVVPYLGVGLGVAWNNWSSTRTRYVPADLQVNLSNTTTAFAYQFIAGAAFPIGSVPGLAITAEYRFFGSLPTKVDGTLSTYSTGRTIASGSLKASNYNDMVLIGLRYNFGRTPPPPPPPPTPAPPVRSYMVFFDWNKADLTDRARQIVADAAMNASRTAVTRIEVSGYTDRSGTPQYNQGLSVRRAEVVAAELVRHGITRNNITTRGFGETNPLVPTAPGVREPQNRRVEIVLK